MGKGTKHGLFTAREAASYLGISRRTLRGLMRDGRVDYLRRGRRVLFRRRDLDEVRPGAPSRMLIMGIMLGAAAMGILRWARLRRRGGGRSVKKWRSPTAPRHATRQVDRRQKLLADLHALLTSHYATTRFMAALLVLNNRRVVDRRQRVVPVSVDRRSGRDRRATPNIDMEVDEWQRRLAVAARRADK